MVSPRSPLTRATITIVDGATTGTLVIPVSNGEDVYLDAGSLTATITAASGGNFENLTIGTASATASVTDTVDAVTVDLAGSSVAEGAVVNYTFTATLSAVSHGVTTITTDQGTITIVDGATTGTLVIPVTNGEDVYLDAGSLTATITAASGGNFENLTIGTASATASVTDTVDAVTVDLAGSSVAEGAVVELHLHGDLERGLAWCHHDHH